MPQTGGGDSGSPRNALNGYIDRWLGLRDEIAHLIDRLEEFPEGGPGTGHPLYGDWKEIKRQLDKKREARESTVDQVKHLVLQNPNLYDVAVDLGFRADLLPGGPSGGGDGDGRPDRDEDKNPDDDGDGDPDKDKDRDKDETKPSLRAQAQDNRLLGDKGKHYDIVRGPKGSYMARYKFNIAGASVYVGVRIPRDQLGKYGIKPDDAKVLTKEQFAKIEDIGWADELAPHVRQGDGHMLKSLNRYLDRQYEGQPVRHNDEVMGVVIANTLFDWDPGTYENQLRQTKWYDNTNAYQRQWATVTSAKEKKETINRTLQEVVNSLEDHYGLNWTKHVPGGMKQAREWAERIASGKLGTPDAGLAYWGERQFDRAAEIEGTNAWITRQQEAEQRRGFLNRPEDKFEELREQEVARFGRTVLDRGTRLQWATDLVTEKMSDGDWEKLMRQTQKRLYPFFDENFSYLEQLSPYRQTLEQELGTTVGWDDVRLQQVAGLDDKGKPTGQARPLHEFAQYIRDTDPRFWDNPVTGDKIDAFTAGVLEKMAGVS